MDNIHSVIAELKKFLYRVQNTTNFSELDILISEVKEYIVKTPSLKDEYNRRITEYNDFYKQNVKEYYAFIRLFERIFKISNSHTNDFFIGTGYYKFLSSCMGVITNEGNIIKAYDSICAFYYWNILLFIGSNNLYTQSKQNKLFTICKKILLKISHTPILSNNIDFAALSCDDIYVYGRAPIIANDFYPLWIKSALIGVLYELQAFLRKEINRSIYNNKYSDIVSENNYINNFNNPLNIEEIEILKLRKTLTTNTYEEIGKNLKPILTGNNVGQKFNDIKNKLGANSPDNAVRIYEEKYGSL